MGVIPSDKIVELAQAAGRSGDHAKQALIRALGDISEIEIFGDNLLVATYIPPEKTKGGIIQTPTTLGEAEFQGNTGLVVKSNFITEEDNPLHKWVMFGYNDGLRFRYNDVPCRIISIDRIRAIVPDPTKVL